MPAISPATGKLSTGGEFVGGTISGGKLVAQLTTTSSKCSRVWIGAPRAGHPKGSPNTSDVFVQEGGTSPATTGGAYAISSDGTRDRWFHVTDPSTLWITNFTTGDCIEWYIEIGGT